MPRPRFDEPRIGTLRLPDLEPGDPQDLQFQGRYELLRFTDLDVSGRNLSGVEFAECELTGLVAHETRLRDARFLECRLERMHAPVLDAPGATLRDVEILGSRLGAVEMHDAEVRTLLLEGSRIDWMNLRSGDLHDVVFRGCRFGELDLSGVTAQRVAFEDCRVDSLQLAGARLFDVDLRGAEIASVGGLGGLKGAVISAEQSMRLAPVFASHFGLLIDE